MLVERAAQRKRWGVTESRSRHCEGWNDKIQGDTQWVEVIYKREEEEEGEEEEDGRQLRHKKCGPPNEAALFHGLRLSHGH
jgi:hypothetical protein